VTRQAVNNEVDLSATLVSMNLDGSEAREVVRPTSPPSSRSRPTAAGSLSSKATRRSSRRCRGPASASTSGRRRTLPLRRLTAHAGEYLHWSGDSRKIHYALGDELFTARLEDSFSFVAGAPAELPKPPEHGQKIGFSAEADKPRASWALTGARIVTMRGDEVIDDGVVVVRDNRIVAVGRRGSVEVPAGAATVDVSGKTIVPGLVDAHWHGSMGEEEVIPQQSWIDYASLAFGVTTLHDPSNDPRRSSRSPRCSAPASWSLPASIRPGRSSTAPRAPPPRRSTP
jgi:hypothetical protein